MRSIKRAQIVKTYRKLCMPRQTKLTREIHDQIVELIEAGNFASVAARACGVSSSTFHRWMQRGEQQKKGPYRLFWDACTRARARAQSKYVEVLREAAKSDWRAAAFFLERTDPEHWGSRRFVEKKSTNINLLDTNRPGITAAERIYAHFLKQALETLRESRELFPDVEEWKRIQMTAERFGVFEADLRKLDDATADAEVNTKVLALPAPSEGNIEDPPPT